MTAPGPATIQPDGGLASEYWHGYYEPAEIAEVLAATTTTTIVAGPHPIHVRIYAQPPAAQPAPTVVMGHGMLVYGQIFARIQLPFFRAGFNVVQFDVPGMGQSGGPRAGCTTADIFAAWSAALDFARARFGAPLHLMGVAEDGVTCYYVAANRPDVAAISVHTLFEYGDPGGVAWLGPPWLVRLKTIGLAVIKTLAPSATIPATRGIPFGDVFGGPGDEAFIQRLIADPLALHGVQFRFNYSLMKRARAPVPFEQCHTPVQIIASERNRIWPLRMLRRNHRRLGGPKELVVLAGKPQWESNVEFHEVYCAHVIRWFAEHGAVLPGRPTPSEPTRASELSASSIDIQTHPHRPTHKLSSPSASASGGHS
jgi:alpha-beta hydrolase superfamily lysophospholipase